MLAAGSASNIFSENSRTQILSYWILHFGCLGELLELFLRTFDYLNVEFSEGQVTKLLLFGACCRYAADSVLGVATIPMKRLMDQPCADGYAPVHGATNVAGKIDDVSTLPLAFVVVLFLM